MPKPQNSLFKRSFASGAIQKKALPKEEGEDSPIIYNFKLSSEEPAEMWKDTYEIMSHDSESADIRWYKSGNAPLLWMHNKDEQIGRVVDGRLVKGALEVDVVFGNSARAQEIQKDVDAGVIRNVSIGYRVHDWELSEKSNKGKETYTATRWEGLEASFVSVPADQTVGVGRSEGHPANALSRPNKDNIGMPEVKITNEDLEKARKSATEQGLKSERERISAITKIASLSKGYNLSNAERKAIDEGVSVDGFRSIVLEHMQKNSPVLTQEGIGATKKEAKKFSLSRAIAALDQKDFQRLAPYEYEVSEAIKEAGGQNGKGMAIPTDVLLKGWKPRDPVKAAAIAGMSTRDLQSVTLNGAGQSDHVSNIVENELMDNLFQYALTEESAILGEVTTIPMVGDGEIPMELIHPTGQWVGEKEEPAEGNYMTGLVPLSFKTYGMRIGFTHRSKVQSTPAIEALLARSLRIQSALQRERTIYAGTGAVDPISGNVIEPTGILNTAGVASVASGGVYSRDALIDLRAAIGIANANAGDAVLVMSEFAAAQFAKSKIDAGSGLFVANYSGDSQGTIETSIGRGRVTNLLPNTANGDSNTVVLFFRPRSVFLAQWGAMMLDIDDTTDRNTRCTHLRLWEDYDLAIPQPANFAAITDLT